VKSRPEPSGERLRRRAQVYGGRDYRVGLPGVGVVGEVLGDVLPPGRSDGIVDGDGEVGGDADGVRSRLGLAPMPPWLESVQPVSVSRATAHSPERSFLIVILLRRSH
jgi:hypothetical protein